MSERDVFVEYRNHLVKKILPFWMGLSDEVYGGFYGYVDKNLAVKKDAHKGCILNSRLLWTFSSAARIMKDERYHACAKRAYEFMDAFRDQKNGGVFWSVLECGRPTDKPIVEEWKCPYHNGRMCLRMIEKSN